MSGRLRLPDRRLSETFDLMCNGLAYRCTISRYADGSLGEIFLSNSKVNSDSDVAAKDSAVVASIALQYGAAADVIRHALLRDSRGVASSPLGVVLDFILDSQGTQPSLEIDLWDYSACDDRAVGKDRAAITATALLQILKTIPPQQWGSAIEAYLRDEFADLARTAINEALAS